MPDHAIIRIYIASPTDVRPERLRAEQIVARLNREFAYNFHVEAVLWEREPLVAAHHFQDPANLPPPRSTDIVVVILWSRLGVPLPEDRFRGAISGRRVTGTEWEFEDALAEARENGVPDLLLYYKQTQIIADLHDRNSVQERLVQLDLVEDFIERWFGTGGDEGYKAALLNFGTVTEFEDKLYGHLRALLERRVVARAEGMVIRWHEAPFRGLLSFEPEHSAVFFGRTQARNELRELLARQVERGKAFVLVFGASGSGKSSLVKAGLFADVVLPGMVGRVALVRFAVMRPSDHGGQLFEALAAATIESRAALPELAMPPLGETLESFAELLRAAPAQAVRPIRRGLAAAAQAAELEESAEARLLIVVDQIEELFTQELSPQADRVAFVATLETLATSGFIWLVATMRSDFFDRLETLPALAALSTDGQFLLLPPDAAELGQIIRQPAQAAGLRFEVDTERGLGLDEVIRQATAGEDGALPLLSFLLDQLWRKRTSTGLLTFAAYDELGGLEGAIGRRAEEVFLAQPYPVQAELASLLRELVTVEGGKAVSRTAPLSRFPAGSPRRALADAFIHAEARLLVADAEAGLAQLRLAHEALLSHWPRAHDQISSDSRDLELRGRLEREAEEWRAAPPRQKKGRVRAPGLPLAEAAALVARWATALPPEVREFVAQSQRAARRRQVRLVGTLLGIVAGLPTIAGLVWLGLVWWGVRQVEAGMAFVPIPAGCFNRGSPSTEAGRSPNEGPVYEVCPQRLELAKFEVTQAQWRRVMVLNPDPSYVKGDDRPVESVSWDEVHQFAWLMSRFGRRSYRLPSEAEWEYASRAGKQTARYWGENADDGCAYENMADASYLAQHPGAPSVHCDDHSVDTAAVGSFKPNGFGLFDMLGNVAEWVEDCYADNYNGTPRDGSSFTGGSCILRVVRGGSWSSDPKHVRAADRLGYAPANRNNFLGFRLARNL